MGNLGPSQSGGQEGALGEFRWLRAQGCMAASAPVALVVHHALPFPRSTPPLCPAANVEFEKHLAEEIVKEKEVGKEAADVPTLPAVPADLFCFSASFCFLKNSSEFTQVGAVLKSKAGFFTPKVWACERENPSRFCLAVCEEWLLLQPEGQRSGEESFRAPQTEKEDGTASLNWQKIACSTEMFVSHNCLQFPEC